MNKKKIYSLIEISLLFICLVTGCISQNSTKELPDQSEETKIVAYALFPQPVLGIVLYLGFAFVGFLEGLEVH